MTFQKLFLSGINIGSMAAMRGSFWFTLTAIPVLGSNVFFPLKDLLDLQFTLMMFFFGLILGVISCLLSSLLPGIVGGIVLAFWLDKRKINSPKELWILGGLVGGLAGLTTSIAVFVRISRDGFGEAFFPFNEVGFIIGACLATLIACWAGIWAALKLHQIIMDPVITNK